KRPLRGEVPADLGALFFFFKQKTAYEIGLGIPAEPLFRSMNLIHCSPLRRGLAIDSTVDIFTFYVPHRHVYGEQWIKFMKDGVNATPLPTVNTTGYIDHARSEERRVGKECRSRW